MRRGKLAAAGVAAVAAAGLAAAPAQASSGKVYACYSKSSHVMTYSKRSHCARGSKSLSWNSAGPQGPQGAQGPAGTTAAFVEYLSGTAALPSVTSDGTTFYGAVVDEFVPSRTGLYVVNAQNTIENKNTGANLGACVIYNEQTGSKSSATLSQYGTIAAADSELPVGVTGAVFASPAHPVVDICLTSKPASVTKAAIDGILVNEVDGKSAVRPLGLTGSANPRQRFRKALAAHRAEAEKANAKNG